jgi:heme/copper-type cytochrome/quinol oxidase subunit 4
MRAIVIIALIAVVAALFTALVFLYRDRGHGNRVVIALAIRVALSMALIAFLVFSWWMGWIQPGGL